jgi:YD repeat-containing protein
MRIDMIHGRTFPWRALGALLLSTLILVIAGAPEAHAVTCPNGNPIVQENNCAGAGTTAWQLDNPNENIAGYATQSSFAKGANIPLKIARNQPTFPATKVNIKVYRMGYYGGLGGREITAAGASNVTVNNSFACNTPDATTGKLDCSNWATTYTISGAALPTSGVYLAKITTADAGAWENSVVFVVRDDTRATPSKMEFVVPTANYQAYNTWGGKSLYFDVGSGQASGPTVPATHTDRAAKVSFNRPIDDPNRYVNRFPNGPDESIVSWIEREGYDVTYTDDYAVSSNPAELKQHKVIVLGAHSEYWSGEQMAGYKAARDAGVSILNLGSNAGYWKVRYEDGGRTLVCYKTIQGSGSAGSGADGVNDPGPDGITGTADDALGADGVAGTADDNPQNATTTFRDKGAANGNPNAPPGGRVGPNTPENALLAVMYMGDNDAFNYDLTIPAADANSQYAGDRIWRNTGIASNVPTTIDDGTVGWEWDAVPTQAQYLAQEPANVKKLTSTNTTANTPNWLQDEGRLYSTVPPPGQPGTVNAVKYRAASGAWVFSSGTNNWALSLDEDRIGQATYNMISDMGVQPVTPDGITTDPAGSNQPPVASFTTTHTTPLPPNTSIQFTGAASTDADGTIVKYEWDLDGDGVYETNTGTTKTVNKTFTSEGTFDVRLRVTDNGGATDTTVRTYTVIANQPPVAAMTASPNPAIATQTVTLDGSGSSDPDGTIAKYEWDLDGNGTYEVNGGTTATRTTSFATAGTYNVGLRVTDNKGKTATTSVPVTVNSGGLSNYGDAVLDTSGLVSYWRMGETAGPTLADSKGTSPATAVGGPAFAQPGGVASDPNTAVGFDGIDDAAHASLDLSGTSVLTVEFWLKWNAYADNDALAMEFTNNFNDNGGGFLVDPNAPQNGGTFGVGLGRGDSRNNVFFTRPSAGAWHHYALVLDTTAPAATQITPYVDGNPVTYTKTASGTGAGSFANALLHFMSRNDLTNNGAGTLDELAIYNKALPASTIKDHFQSFGTNRRPVARFTMTPSSVKSGQTVTFDGSTSSDPDGTITKYEWDLDGNGTYETNTGTTKTVTKTYTQTSGSVPVGLKVTDNAFGADTETHTLTVGDQPPTAALTVTPNPAVIGQTATLNASGSTDADGSIVKYEFDLDGNGTYETNTGTTKTATTTFATPGTYTVGVRVTDDGGNTATKQLPLTVNSGGVSNYGDAVTDTPGLVSYWRMGEASGTTLASSVTGGPSATTQGGVTLGVPGAVANDPNTAARFDGSDDAARGTVDLSGTSKATVEFWMKWNAYANDDDLAMEFTNNFNDNAGGFLVDPNAPQNGGTFGVGIGSGASRNNVFFTRPSAGAWHHYAFVFDTTAAGADQITPYVDGQPVTYTKGANGTGAGAFANATLNLMSRAGAGLYGAGDLDEVAVYKRALDAATIADHYTSQGTNRRPVAAFTAPSTAKPGQTVTFDASASHDPDGSITKYEWDLDGNGTYETSTGTTPSASRSYATAGDVTVKLKVTDNDFATDTESHTVTIGNASPAAALSVSPTQATVGQTVTLDATGSADPDGTIAKYEFDLDGNGTYETNAGTTKTATTSFIAAGAYAVGVRVTDDDGATDTATKTVTVKAAGASYSATVLGTPGLLSYWRMGESSGTSLADASGGSHTATVSGGALGVAGALGGDADTAVRFNGSSSYAQAPLNLSGTQTVTVEFWLKWNAWVNDDDLAMEFTDNFNANGGGFLVDPNASNGYFGVALGQGSSRNTAYFTRPSAGVWHHYVFVIDASAPAATQVTPYVDGAAVSYFKGDNGTGAGPFANANLYFMSRAGGGLFGAGDLDEVAIYGQALTAAQAAAHHDAGTP